MRAPSPKAAGAVRRRLLRALLVAVTVAASACSATDEPFEGEGEQLAYAHVEALPDSTLSWQGWEASGEVSHTHGPAFVFASAGSHTMRVGRREVVLSEGEAIWLSAETDHVHGEGVFLEVHLRSPGAPPDGLEGRSRPFASPVLEDVPPPPVDLRFIRLELAPGDETEVVSYPGPAFSYVLEGVVSYRAGRAPAQLVRAGEDRTLPPDTAVQARNSSDDDAVLLMWTITDPRRPFAPPARFPDDDP